MRLSAVLFLIVIVFNCYQTALAQSKNETAKWISNKGEEILRDITGNSSIQWQMDAYGRLKITNYKPKKEEEAIIVKRYSYLNLYELDWKGGLLRKSTEEENKNKLLLRCKALSKA